ncbi:MAG: hypothetical protein HZB12_00805 [Candidatus Yonathbacteria bacterium]|nr:hypothetical protein [Candidatus Yonathbacteria bacterium]
MKNEIEQQGAGAIIGDQLKVKGLDLRLVVDKDRGISSAHDRHTKQEDADTRSAMLREAYKRLVLDEKRARKEIAEAISARSVWVDNIANIEALLKKSGSKGNRRLEALLSQAKDHLHILDSVFPHEDSSGGYDEKVFNSIVAKFKDYEHARRKQTIAEIDLNKKGGSIGKHEEARNEAIKLREEISSLIQQGEDIIVNKESNPVRNEGVAHTNDETLAEKKYLDNRARNRKPIAEEGASIINTVAMETNPDEMLLIAPEGAAGTAELARGDDGGGIEQGSKSDPGEMRIRTTVEKLARMTREENAGLASIEFTMEGKPSADGARVGRVEARMVEVLKRQIELEGKTDIASAEEKVELEKEAASLKAERETISRNKPLQSAYDATMDRIWKENEAKRKAKEEKDIETPIGKETQGSDVAQAIIAERERIVAEGQKSKVPEDGISVLTEVVGEAVGVAQKGQVKNVMEETAEKPVDAPADSKEALSTLKERMLNNIARADEKVKMRFEKIGMTEKFFRIAERFNAFKKEHKVAYTSFMVLAGAGSLATGTALAGGSVGAISGALRFVTGVGVFYSKEKEYKKEAEKHGRERTEAERSGDRLKAVAWGVVMGGLLSYVLGESARQIGEQVASFVWGGPEAMRHAVKVAATSIHEAGKEAVRSVNLEEQISLGQANLAALEHLDEAPATPTEVAGDYIATAEAGDSVWKLAQEQLETHYGERFAGLSEAQQTYLIDAIKDKITADPEHFGIGSGDANVLAVGDEVDFKEIFDDTQFMDDQFAEVQGLTPEETTNIENYSGNEGSSTPQETADTSAAPETPARTVSPAEAASYYRAPSAEAVKTLQETSVAQMLAHVDQQFHDDINVMFGKEGFLGFGAVDGMKSQDWLDFENRTPDEIRDATPTGGANSIGINNPEAHGKMEKYLKNVFEKSGIQPEDKETIGAYIKRAMETTARNAVSE